jgi:hypothetical protein
VSGYFGVTQAQTAFLQNSPPPPSSIAPPTPALLGRTETAFFRILLDDPRSTPASFVFLFF